MFTQITEWLSWLEQRNPHNIELGLERITTVLNRLNLQPFPPIITVAGTNGKGSCVAFLEAIYQAAGYQSGVYTSPHLLKYNERIRVNSQEISDDELCNAFAAVYSAQEDIPLTYFEITTLVALWHFNSLSLDVLILEVGLGGRLDAVNCVTPNVSVITTIDLDHMDWLGDTREKIGREKAGIFRSNIPAVCGDFAPPTSIIHTAKQLRVPLFLQGREFGYRIKKSKWEWWGTLQRLTELPIPKLPIQNAATALMAIQQLPNLPISVKNIVTGLEFAKLPGRFQRLYHTKIETILDVAHNPQSIDYLARKMALKPISGKTIAVCGMLKDKDCVNSLKSLIELVDHWHFTDLPLPRGRQATELAEILKTQRPDQSYECYLTPIKAYEAAAANCTKNDRIIVFGSFLIVADMLRYCEFIDGLRPAG